MSEQKMRYAGPILGGAVGSGVGAVANAYEKSVAKFPEAYREPTLDEARVEFAKQVEAVQAAYRHMSETTDPEVFAFRANRLPEIVSRLERAAFSVSYLALQAATK